MGPGSVVKILIADDSRFQVKALSLALADMGFELCFAFDALQAWMTAIRETPNAVILDINMPGGSGIEVLKRLRLSTKTQHIPVIVVSGSDDASTRQSVTELGAVAFLHKPFDVGQLRSILSTLLALPTHPTPNVTTASGH